MKIKRVLCGLLATALVVASFAGCQNNTGSSTPASTGDGSSTSDTQQRWDGTTITGVVPGSNWLDAVLENVDEFTEQTGVQVELQQLMNDQVTQKVAVSMAAGGSDLDLVIFAPLQNSILYHKNGWLENLDNYIANDENIDYDDFSESSTELCTFDDGVYGIPYMTECEVVMYNTEMFEKAGVTEIPTTFDELEAAAAACHGIETDVAGIVYRGKPYAAVTQASGFIYGYGGEYINSENKAVFNTPEAVQGIYKYGNILYKYGAPGSINMDWQDTANVYNQGMAAMRIDASSNYNYCIDPDSSLVADVTSMFALPGGPAGAHAYNVTAWALGISTGSQNKDATWAFISWATSKEMDVKTMGNGNPSPRESSWQNDEAVSAFPEIMVEVMNQTIPTAVATDRPTLMNVADARTEIGNVIMVAVEGGTIEEVQAAADKAVVNVQKLIDEEANS